VTRWLHRWEESEPSKQGGGQAMSTPFQILVFTIASIGLIRLSRASLHDPRSHGFYRFFAWEAILALTLMNLNYWFAAPFSVRQMLSWLLLAISLVLIIGGVQMFRLFGKPDARREAPSLVGIEKTTELVTVGLYRYIRHPFYSSLLFLIWGVYLKRPLLVGFLLAAAATVLLVVTARIEEAENMRFFGDDYGDYMRRTRMFIPFIL
jgi:protein-S-isoprenylcysteine O-methyltransferase Ste14